MSKAATEAEGNTRSRVNHPSSPLTPPRDFSTIEFSATYGMVQDRARGTQSATVESSANCVGVCGAFSEMFFRLSVNDGGHFSTLGASLKDFPDLKPEETGMLLKKSFWNEPLNTDGPGPKTRKDFVNEKLAELSRDVSDALKQGGHDKRDRLNGLLQATIEYIGSRLALEILLLSNPKRN